LIVLALAALALAATSANASPALTTATPWWEKVTYTISDDGAQQVCRYETSLSRAGEQGCGEDEGAAAIHEASSGSPGPYTKITIERRFTPGSSPNPVALETGDTLLGGQVMALAIDGNGAVQSCQLIGASGEVKTPYGCEEAKAERFEASASSAPTQVRYGYMTILVYGHEEYPV
jgi:hypothetical protein